MRRELSPPLERRAFEQVQLVLHLSSQQNCHSLAILGAQCHLIDLFPFYPLLLIIKEKDKRKKLKSTLNRNEEKNGLSLLLLPPKDTYNILVFLVKLYVSVDIYSPYIYNTSNTVLYFVFSHIIRVFS